MNITESSTTFSVIEATIAAGIVEPGSRLEDNIQWLAGRARKALAAGLTHEQIRVRIDHNWRPDDDVIDAQIYENFYVTFGQQYWTTEHPALPGVTPDHYVRIVAADADEARRIAFNRIGEAWAFLYPEDVFRFDLYPAGEYAALEEGDNK